MEDSNNPNTDGTKPQTRTYINKRNQYSPQRNQNRYSHSKKEDQPVTQHQYAHKFNSPNQSPDRPALPPNALIQTIDPQLKQLYRAAGTIIYSYVPESHKLMILLGVENRSKKKSGEDAAWCHFGGKIEKEDENEPSKTALREFHEETANMFLQPEFTDWTASLSSELNSDTSYKYWWTHGKYITFLAEVPYIADLPSKYNEYEAIKKQFTDKEQLQWIEWDQLKPKLQYRSPYRPSNTSSPQSNVDSTLSELSNKMENLNIKTENNNHEKNQGQSTEEKNWMLSKFFRDLISGNQIRRHLDSLQSKKRLNTSSSSTNNNNNNVQS